MENKIILGFNRVTLLCLAFGTAFTNKPTSRGQYITHKCYLFLYIIVMGSLVISVLIKSITFIEEHNWESLLDTLHMLLLEVYIFCFVLLIRTTVRNYKESMDQIGTKFHTTNDISLGDLSSVITMWVALFLSIISYYGYGIYKREPPLALWLPFIDNSKAFPPFVQAVVWAWEILSGLYVWCVFGVWGPFILVCSTCIKKEIKWLKEYARMHFSGQTVFVEENRKLFYYRERGLKLRMANIKEVNPRDIIRNFVEHDMVVRRALKEVSNIHNLVFLMQTIFMVSHSCLLTFHLYHSQRILEASMKSVPILITSYYVVFVYCWNGQQITHTYDMFRRSVHFWPWYRWSKKSQSSFKILLEVYKAPVKLSAFGVFSASLPTFLTCMQQGISFLLLLRALTPNEEKSSV